MLRIGIDVGSTTAKIVAIGEDGKVVFSAYRRHNAKAKEIVSNTLRELIDQEGDQDIRIRVTGSVGMGLAEEAGIQFVQEVVAATKAIQTSHPEVVSMIDIGGEDAKVVFFKDGHADELRMNGNCAGGTGAFIDQMAVILGISVDEMNDLAMKSDNVYPIASRCGVFCKTDIQNLVAQNVSRNDIAASIFHAVTVQTVVTLAHGCTITPPILFCGGPLTFLPALRKAFVDYLGVEDTDIILPEHSALLPAIGSAMYADDTDKVMKISELIDKISQKTKHAAVAETHDRLFENEQDYNQWKERMSRHHIERGTIAKGQQDVFLGIDSGSTTTKITLLNDKSQLLFEYYSPNGGDPVGTVEKGLRKLSDECKEKGAVLNIKGSCSTGYGEDLIRQAFQLHSSIIETIGHYLAAKFFDPQVSFILDIGGQDMKAIFVNDGVIDRIEINEACSSGCGSFIETFAKTMGYSVEDFAKAACRSKAPSDLGTRCTVFMNSKVKQVLREGASVEDIAGGLACSVMRNCLYKVLKLKNADALGKHIVVQGGTMHNDAVVKALENLTGTEVTRSDIPELMGAFGCALYAKRHAGEALSLDDIINKATYTTSQLHCKGCENQCRVTRYNFGSGKAYYSGNRCERIFTNGDKSLRKGKNIYKEKYHLLFDRKAEIIDGKMRLGIPRVLNMYEEYPFWHTLFTQCGIDVVLSDESKYTKYEQSACMVMSDNICFPAKLVHSHIQNLTDKKVDRIFMPFVIHERQHKEQNSYNCPVVTGYSEVIKSVQQHDIPIDSPDISFKDDKLLKKACLRYLESLGIAADTATKAFDAAVAELDNYVTHLTKANDDVVAEAANQPDRLVILLAGRPYHTDPLIQHKVSAMMAGMGIDVITDDVVNGKDWLQINDSHYVSQWSYPNRILRAAKWCASQGRNVQFVEFTSFGCGPDAFLVDIVRDLLMRYGKSLTLLKLDDINNVGSMKLRVRSLVESLRMAKDDSIHNENDDFNTVPPFGKKDKHRKILVPFFTPFISPLIPSVLKYAGYEAEALPLSDQSSCDWGLKYANNEVCYPATLVVGDIIRAFKDGSHDPDKCAVGITQTGGQCRASNYISLIKKALVDAGYSNVPVVSLTLGGDMGNQQPGFKFNWAKMAPIALRAIIYSDCIAKMYNAAVVRENTDGESKRLRDKYLKLGAQLIDQHKTKDMFSLLPKATQDFQDICKDMECPKVGVVGEIFLKFNPFAHRNIMTWLNEHGIEVVSPSLTDFFMQKFVNQKEYAENLIRRKNVMAKMISKSVYKLINKQINKANSICSQFKYFLPFGDIFDEAEHAKKFITLSAQFGEGWLLPAEIVSYAQNGIKDVVSLQPFGCIANHIVARGIEKRIKTLIPDINILFLDFDSGVSDVNVTNRLLLFIDRLKNPSNTEQK